jgi:hypothetical protein
MFTTSSNSPDNHSNHHSSGIVTLHSNRVEAIHRCVQHIRVWLGATGLTYNHAARESFVRAHPALFGRAYEVTLRGYDRWRTRHAIADTVDGFARYIARRHQRWIAATGLAVPSLAPCLIGTATTQPCWRIADGGANAQIERRTAA